jgi:hypothetical protein
MMPFVFIAIHFFYRTIFKLQFIEQVIYYSCSQTVFYTLVLVGFLLSATENLATANRCDW